MSGDDNLGAYGDEFYAKLMGLHQGLSLEESARLNARLILLMANAIGDPGILGGILEKGWHISDYFLHIINSLVIRLILNFC